MARKSSADTAKQKAAKQKKMAIGLSVVLVLAMGYAVKTMMSLNGGGSKPVAADTTSTPVPSTSTTPVTATPATTTPATAAPSLSSPNPSVTPAPPVASTATGGAPTTSGELVSAAVPTAGVGQMQSFSEFVSKDPFAKPTTSTSAKPSGTKKPAAKPATPATGGSKPAAVAPTSAVISVNGTSESVNAGGSFPAASPLFQLLSLTKTTAKVTVIGGSYASGAAALTLTVNKAVTLVNTADGTRYTLLLFPQGTAAPAGASGPSAAAPPATTTPTTTTTTTR